MSDVKVALAHSPERQRALFGYAVSDAKVFQMVHASFETLGPIWVNAYLAKLWNAMLAYRKASQERHPTVAEIQTSPEVIGDDALTQKRTLQELDMALKARVDFDYNVLESDLIEWRRFVLLKTEVTEIARLYNRSDIDSAGKTVEKLASALELLNNSKVNRLEPSAVRLFGEEEDRQKDLPWALSYGVSFLDECTGGILPRSLIVIGGKTGYGKTQLITRVAEANAQAGKRVTLLALEAEDREIERRLKYEYIVREAIKDGLNPIEWSYQDWRLCKLKEADKYESEATRHLLKALANMRTFYRNSGDFGVDEMERLVGRAAKESDLVILDHLHYVDVDGDNENTEYKRVVKKLRDLALNHGVPIVVIAHLRKTQGGRSAAIVPQLDDFHGTSDITKIATTVIAMGRPKDIEYSGVAGTRPYGIPTYLRLVKHRVEGARTWQTAIAFFQGSGYASQYAIGQLTDFDTKWEPYQKRPYWAVNGTVPILGAC